MKPSHPETKGTKALAVFLHPFSFLNLQSASAALFNDTTGTNCCIFSFYWCPKGVPNQRVCMGRCFIWLNIEKYWYHMGEGVLLHWIAWLLESPGAHELLLMYNCRCLLTWPEGSAEKIPLCTHNCLLTSWWDFRTGLPCFPGEHFCASLLTSLWLGVLDKTFRCVTVTEAKMPPFPFIPVLIQPSRGNAAQSGWNSSIGVVWCRLTARANRRRTMGSVWCFSASFITMSIGK